MLNQICCHLHPPSAICLEVANHLTLLACTLQVERLLDGVDAVLYLLDYSKLKTAEEAALLGKLKVCGCTYSVTFHDLHDHSI